MKVTVYYCCCTNPRCLANWGSYLTTPFQLVYDLLLYGVYVVFYGVLWEEAVHTPGFVGAVAR